MNQNNTVECTIHGLQQETFVCQHIVQGLKEEKSYGFWYADDPDNPRPDAWCTSCNEMIEANGGEWDEKTEKAAGVTLLCGACYDRAKGMNLS